MAVWRKSLFATMHLNANLPAAYLGVPAAQVVEVGIEVRSRAKGRMGGASPSRSEIRQSARIKRGYGIVI